MRKPRIKRVYLCSPLAATANYTIEDHLLNALAYYKNLDKGHAGDVIVAPHLLLSGALLDADPKDRKAGLACAKILLERCDVIYVFKEPGSLTLSKGMIEEIDLAKNLNIPVMHVGEKEHWRDGEIVK